MKNKFISFLETFDVKLIAGVNKKCEIQNHNIQSSVFNVNKQFFSEDGKLAQLQCWCTFCQRLEL